MQKPHGGCSLHKVQGTASVCLIEVKVTFINAMDYYFLEKFYNIQSIYQSSNLFCLLAQIVLCYYGKVVGTQF